MSQGLGSQAGFGIPKEFPKAPQIHPISLAAWALILIWAFATIFLLDYYMQGNVAGSERMVFGQSKYAFGMVLEQKDAAAAGIGASTADKAEFAYALRELIKLRTLSKEGDFASIAAQADMMQTKYDSISNERFRVALAKPIACARSACSNEVYISSAAQLAAADPLVASHAIVLEAYYWHEAQASGNLQAQARAIVRLESLVSRYGTYALKEKWATLKSCKGECPLFEELLLDFIGEALRP